MRQGENGGCLTPRPRLEDHLEAVGEGGVAAAGSGLLTAAARALRDPARTTSFLARVMPVYRRLRCSIIHALVVSGMTPAGYSDPWERWMVTA